MNLANPFTLVFKILITFSALGFLSSCDDNDDTSGGINPYTVELGNYDELEIHGSAQVSICDSCDFDLQFTGSQSDYENLSAQVSGGRLIINGGNGQVVLGNHHLKYIELKGSSSITGDSIMHTSYSLIIDAKGNSSVNLSVAMHDLNIFTAGTADVIVDGEALNLHFETNGSSTINSLGIEAENAFSTLSGSGLIELYTSDSLYARVNGSGTIRYKGEPTFVDSEVTGSGAIIEIP